MKLRLPIVVVLAASTWVHAAGGRSGGSVRVSGYGRANGTYVGPHFRSAPDGNFYNNWSTRGNTNPYTGVAGTRTAPPRTYAGMTGAVYVSGYQRADGTYVSSHLRSAPDGNSHNNWSTQGNINPYTGVAGTRSASPGVDYHAQKLQPSPISPSTSANAPPSKQSRNDDAWTRAIRNSTPPDTNRSPTEKRIDRARELAELGHNVNWQEHSYAALDDMLSRIRLANQLPQVGHRLDWQRFSQRELSELLSIRGYKSR